MLDFCLNIFKIQREKVHILPDYLPLAFQGQTPNNSKHRVYKADDNPRVIFLGAPERYGKEIDSIDDQFMELAKEHIHVYSGFMREEVKATGFGHTYSRFSNNEVFRGRLAEFVRQFDAALITYNVIKRHERFRTTYPTRFLTALTAGVPIAIRAGIFDACERFVREYGIGFVYESGADLRDKLMDKEMIFEHRRCAQEFKKVANAEAQSSDLKTIIESVINK